MSSDAALLVATPLVGAVDSSPTAGSAADEEVLVRQAAKGNRTAFAELVRRHQGKVRGLLLRLSGDRTLADDLAQEVFLRAFRGLCGFEGRASFATWLYRISYNAYLNHSTRTRKYAALPERYDTAAVAPDDALSAPRADLRRDLEGAVAGLPDRYRGVVVLFYLQELTYPEIAEILDLPLGTVKTHLHRAKRLLRAKLGEVAIPDDGEVELEDAP